MMQIRSENHGRDSCKWKARMSRSHIQKMDALMGLGNNAHTRMKPLILQVFQR